MRRLGQTLTLAVCLFFGSHARAQGCSQCRDNLAATSPQTQAAYRHAILILTLAGTAVFAATAVAIKRFR